MHEFSVWIGRRYELVDEIFNVTCMGTIDRELINNVKDDTHSF